MRRPWCSAVLLVLASSCQPSAPPVVCTPGTSQTCLGLDGCDGIQVCVAEGTGYSVCRCNRDAGPPPDASGGPDAGRPLDAGPGARTCEAPAMATQYTLLVAHRTVPLAEGDEAIGFDLDAFDSGPGSSASGAVCEQARADFVSPWDGVSGVDNQAQSLVATLDSISPITLQEGLDASIADGTWLTVVQVTDVDDPRDDPSVVVRLIDLPDGTILELADDGRPTPFQSVGGTIVATSPGRIVDGRVEATFGRVALGAPMGLLVPDPLDDVRLRFDLCAAGMERGVLAGSVSIEKLVSEFETAQPGTGPTARSILEGVADIDPRLDRPTVCERLSFALAIEAVWADLEPAP
ncbi:MAG: hypothetical protein R3B82_25775 [Sandaracinaceae bacterium]